VGDGRWPPERAPRQDKSRSVIARWIG